MTTTVKRRPLSLLFCLPIFMVFVSATPALAKAGKVTEFGIPTNNSQPAGITLGPDGNLWFIEINANQIGKVTPKGFFTEYPIPTANATPQWITLGPDGNLWFTESRADQIE